MKNKNKNEFNKLPVKVSQKDFNQYIRPYLSKGKRGPDPNISYYKIFNYILYVLHTGLVRNCLLGKKRYIGLMSTATTTAGLKTAVMKTCSSIQLKS